MPQSSLTGWLTKSTRPKPLTPAEINDSGGQSLDGERLRKPESIRQSVSSSVPQKSPVTTSSTPLVNDDRKLPTNVELRACIKEDIPHLKRLNSLLLPIPYPEKFYREIIEDPLTNSITLVAVWHDDPKAVSAEKGRLIGAIRCRILAHPPSSGQNAVSPTSGPILYLSTLVLLSPYRTHGIASSMLKILTKRAVNDYCITSVGAHVWEANADGLEWYRKRGFKEVGREEGYYHRLKPGGAVIVQRDVSVMDMMNG